MIQAKKLLFLDNIKKVYDNFDNGVHNDVFCLLSFKALFIWGLLGKKKSRFGFVKLSPHQHVGSCLLAK